MTREFNKQQRNDRRPSFRDSSSNRYGDTRPPRSNRPRLNREAVDRAWREGAQYTHPDYHPRGAANSHPQSGRGQQRPGSPTSYNKPGNPNFRGQRRNDVRHFEQAPHDEQDTRSRPFPTGERPYSRRIPMTPGRTGARRSPFEQDYGRNTPHSFERSARPSQSDSYRSRGAQQQQRPSTRQRFTPSYGNTSPEGHDNEQFEGDYEQFTGHNDIGERRSTSFRQTPRARRGGTPPRGRAPKERHVTSLPDGRVMKGPRPVQRRNAQFWTEIAGDADQLLHHKPIAQEQQRLSTNKPEPAKRSKKQAAGSTKRKNAASSARTRGPRKARTNSIRPTF